MYIIHIYTVFFHPVHGYWHQITLGHVYKHHLGALRLLAVAVVAAVAIRAVAADLSLCRRVCPTYWGGTFCGGGLTQMPRLVGVGRCRMISLREAGVGVTVLERPVPVARVMFTAVTVMFLRDAMIIMMRLPLMTFLLLRRSCCRRRLLAFPPLPPLISLPPFSFRPPFTIISCMRLWRP